MYQIDLNSDLGESFGHYTIGNDDKIIPLITSANVACGYHASDPSGYDGDDPESKRKPGSQLGPIRDFQI